MSQDTPPDVANATTMRAFVPRFVSLAFGALAVALGGCQGNLGSGSGLNIPQTQPYGQPGGPGGGAAPQSRQRSLDGAVYLTPEMATLPLPPLGGFAITLQLGTAPPSPSPMPSASASLAPASSSVPRRTKMRALASAAPIADPSPAPSPSPSPSPSASGAAPVASASAAAPRASGAPSPTPSATAASSTKSHAAAAIPKSVTKLVVYPEDAPIAPTPQPTGAVQSYPVRKALVRGVLRPATDVTLYGLAAVKFTIPTEEDTTSRGYTVAVYTAGRRHHDALLASDAKAIASAHVVSSGELDSLVLKRNTTYLFVLYGDELPGAPGIPSGYPSPGINPFVTPQPGSATTPQPGYGVPGNAPTPTGTFVR